MEKEKSYAQLHDGVKNYKEFEAEVAKRLKQYILLKPTRKTVKLVRRLYNQGYGIADTVGIVILNS